MPAGNQIEAAYRFLLLKNYSTESISSPSSAAALRSLHFSWYFQFSRFLSKNSGTLSPLKSLHYPVIGHNQEAHRREKHGEEILNSSSSYIGHFPAPFKLFDLHNEATLDAIRDAIKHQQPQILRGSRHPLGTFLSRTLCGARRPGKCSNHRAGLLLPGLSAFMNFPGQYIRKIRACPGHLSHPHAGCGPPLYPPWYSRAFFQSGSDNRPPERTKATPMPRFCMYQPFIVDS